MIIDLGYGQYNCQGTISSCKCKIHFVSCLNFLGSGINVYYMYYFFFLWWYQFIPDRVTKSLCLNKSMTENVKEYNNIDLISCINVNINWRSMLKINLISHSGNNPFEIVIIIFPCFHLNMFQFWFSISTSSSYTLFECLKTGFIICW